MGLADRDYMRDRHRDAIGSSRPFGPPEPSVGLTLWMILLITGLAYGSFKLWTWFNVKNSPSAAQNSTVTPPTPPSKARTHPGLTGNWDPNREVAATPPVPSQQNSQTHVVIKCIVNGATLYVQSESECTAHAKKTILVINSRQNLSDAVRPPQETTPPPIHVVQAAPAPQTAVDPNVHKKALCQSYEEEIKYVDARARQPISAGEQDDLAERRKKARDAQFRLRC
jgi:hypothetical protein